MSGIYSMALTQIFVFGIIRKVESGLKIKEFERGHPIQQNPINSWDLIYMSCNLCRS